MTLFSHYYQRNKTEQKFEHSPTIKRRQSIFLVGLDYSVKRQNLKSFQQNNSFTNFSKSLSHISISCHSTQSTVLPRLLIILRVFILCCNSRTASYRNLVRNLSQRPCYVPFYVPFVLQKKWEITPTDYTEKLWRPLQWLTLVFRCHCCLVLPLKSCNRTIKFSSITPWDLSKLAS